MNGEKPNGANGRGVEENGSELDVLVAEEAKR